MRKLVFVATVVLLAVAPGVRADFDVKCDLENLSGEAKTDWPVILKVVQVLGRDLPAGAVNPKGFHVFDEAGKEIPCAIEEQYPALHPGGYELIFVVPKMAAGAKLTYRVTNTAAESKTMAPIDVVAGPHNLIAEGGFEGGETNVGKHWSGKYQIVADEKRSGKSAMLIAATGRTKVAYTAKIPLHKGSWYYAGVWSKTDNIARHGVAAGSGGAITVTGLAKQNEQEPRLAPTCYTRPWNKLCLFGRYQLECDEWGVTRTTVPAEAEEMTVEINLDQKKQFTMDTPEGKWWLDDMVVMEQPKVTVRFDLLLAPLMKDGVFLFTRPTSAPIGDAPAKEKETARQAYAVKPFPHQAVERIDREALKGQRAQFLVGIYHTRPMEKVSMTAPRASAATEQLAPESIEYSCGVLGEAPHYYLIPQTNKVDFAGPEGVRYFLATFRVPADAKPGKYTSKLILTEGDKTLKEIPISITVQDMVQPALKDRWIGSIFQSGPVVYTQETITVFGRQGFSCVTIFGSFFKFKNGPDGLVHVDADDLATKMGWLKDNGFAAVSIYSDYQLDDKPRGPGRIASYMYREAAADPENAKLKAALDAASAQRKELTDRTGEEYKKAEQAAAAANEGMMALQKKAYARMVLEIDAVCKKNPDWPIILHMNWDEPGGPHPKMGWTNEILPQAESTADLGFGVIPSCSKYFTIPCIDDPADFSGPELYGWIKKQGKKVGIAASARKDEFARYQVGVLVASADIRYLHSWHVQGLMQPVKVGDKKICLRSLGLVGAGEGMDDLKAVTLLREAIAKAEAGSDAAAKAKAAAAKKFLDETFAVWNGDHLQASGNPPYFGLACTWGYDRFYEDFQVKVLRHAAEVLGVKWIE